VQTPDLIIHEPEFVMPAICSAHRVPQNRKNACSAWFPFDKRRRPNALPLTDADGGGLRRDFRDRDGLLHTVVSANSRHHGCLRS
jgi:hypothetical protein